LESKEGIWESLSMLTKLASAFFILGKVTGFMTFITYFVNLALAKLMLMVYATFIGISILFSVIEMFSTRKRSAKPTKEQVEAWAREYKLLEGN